MDEIDAALDFRNVSIVANYIKDRTKNAQFIIISLRCGFHPPFCGWNILTQGVWAETICSSLQIGSSGYTRLLMPRRVRLPPVPLTYDTTLMKSYSCSLFR
jgi:hypothetical protein